MLWSLCLLKLFRGVPGFREMILFGEWKETYAKEKSLHTFQDMDWIELEFDIRENSQKHPTKKGLHEGFAYWIRPLWNFCVDGTSLLSHYVGCLGMYQALWYCLSMSLLAYQRNRNSFIFDLWTLTFFLNHNPSHKNKALGHVFTKKKTDANVCHSWTKEQTNGACPLCARRGGIHQMSSPWCHSRVLCHDLRLNSNRVLKGFIWKNDRGRRSKNDTPKDIQCRYYRTWKTIGDALIYPKHTAFTINIHHASCEKSALRKTRHIAG